MLKQITQRLRTAATLSAAALTLVACGGGEDLALNPPSNQPTTTAVSIGDEVGEYSFEGIATGATTFAKSGSVWTLSSTRAANAGSWSTAVGVLTVTGQPTGAKNKTSLGFTLASGGNTEILIRLKASDYVDQACTPTFKATGLSPTAKPFTVALSDFKSSNDITADCGTQTATAVNLTDFEYIEITDRKETTGVPTINATLSALNWVVAP